MRSATCRGSRDFATSRTGGIISFAILFGPEGTRLERRHTDDGGMALFFEVSREARSRSVLSVKLLMCFQMAGPHDLVVATFPDAIAAATSRAPRGIAGGTKLHDPIERWDRLPPSVAGSGTCSDSCSRLMTSNGEAKSHRNSEFMVTP